MPLKFDYRDGRRLHLKKPAIGMASGGPVQIFDFSLTGIGIGHDFEIKAGTETFIEFNWGTSRIHLWCTVAHCRLSNGTPKYRSGLIVKNRGAVQAYREQVKAALEKQRLSEKELPPPV